MVGAAGFEPAALWSQTRCATKLRYAPILYIALFLPNLFWQGWQDSNPRHSVLETDVPPTELHPYIKWLSSSILRYGGEGGI